MKIYYNLQILEWCNNTENEILKGDGIIISGDFNSAPNSAVCNILRENGFKSAAFEALKKEEITYPTGSWTYADLVEKKMGDRTLDYIWYKGDINVKIAQIVGKQSIRFKHRGDSYKLHPSDHFGIFAKFSV